MKLTPLEVRQKKFNSSFRGLDTSEVEEFLQIVSEEMEEVTRENNELKDKLARLDERLEDYQSREKTLKETLITAQEMAEDIKQLAERESKAILSSAELEGERIIRDTMRRREGMVSEIHELKRQKVQFESTLRSSIEIHLKMLDAMDEQREEVQQDFEKTSFENKDSNDGEK